jgi:hypothetical protein
MKDLPGRNPPLCHPVPRTDTELADDGLKSSCQLTSQPVSDMVATYVRQKWPGAEGNRDSLCQPGC